MRIDRLDLTAFGPFTASALDLSGGSQGLHLVYGPNEAGKSSALRAVKQFFCGIPHVSPDNFLHNYTSMEIGATLRDRAGATLRLVRRKRNRNSLVQAGGPPNDDAEPLLARALGGVGAAEFVQKFVIDHAELVAGGKDVVGGRGDLGQMLFAAGSGLTGLGSVQKALDAQAEELFKRGGSKPRINELIAELDAARKRVKDDALRSTEWVDLDQSVREARARKVSLGRDLDGASRERNRLTRLAEARAPAARREAVLGELAGLAGVPRLPAGFTFARRDALSLLSITERHEADLARSLAEMDAALEALDVPGPLLDEAAAVEALTIRLGSQRQAARARVGLESERDRAEAEARATLRELGRDPAAVGADDEALDALRLRASDRAAIHELAASRQALAQALDKARKDRDKHNARRAADAAKLAALGPDRDPAAIKKALKQARARGDLDTLLREARESLARDERRAASDLKKLGRWAGPLDEAEALAVPTAESVDAFGAEFDADAKTAADLARALDDLDAKARQADAKVEQLRLAGDVPSEAALGAARDRRDAAWRRLKQARAWSDAVADEFEPAARLADDLADRLRREANRVAEFAGLAAERSRLDLDRAAVRAALETAAARGDALRGRWLALWEPLGVGAPGAPREMTAWLREQAKLAALARSVREARDARDGLEAQAEAHRLALARALEDLGEPAPAGATLADLAERAEEAAESARKAADERRRLAREVEAHDHERAALERDAESAQLAWEGWEARWAAAMSRIDQPPDAPVASAVAVLDRSDRLFDRLDQARGHRRKLDESAREAAEFAADVRALAARVAPDLAAAAAAPFDPDAACSALAARLTRARADHSERAALLERRAEHAQAAAAARETIAASRARLESLRREARCESVDDLPAVEERSARRLALEAELDALDARLKALAAATPLDAFLAEAAGSDPDDLPRRVERLDETIAALGREREQLDESIGRGGLRLEQMDGGPAVAEIGQGAEDLRARIKTDVEQYARLKLASAVLRGGIERYRKKFQGPVLDRASALFARLTLGSFEGLKVDYGDRDEPLLKGVRPGGGGLAGVECMSLGTADQLYLAVRLASLETYLDRPEPLPLIVDDVLIQFDDARAAATLEVLAALSKRTQVLVFTHHNHLRALAETHVPADALVVHTLSSDHSR